MLLYLVVDTKNHSVTAPAIAMDLQEAETALKTINPENLEDLKIHPLTTFISLYDLFLLDINHNKSLPDFLNNRSALADEVNDATHQVEDAVVCDDHI